MENKKPKILNRFWRLTHLYRIINKEWLPQTFVLNESQKLIYRLEKQYKRIIILKARQLWMTTYKLIDKLDTVLFYKNKTEIITAHTREKQQELFQRVKYAYEALPAKIKLSNWKIRSKPKTTYDNVNELYFKETNSRIKVALDSRSWTPTSIHNTELAFRKDARAMMTGTLPSLPKNATMTIETTANGIGNYFHELRYKYYWKKNLSELDFKCVFIPRYTDQDYKLDLEDGEELVIPEKLKHIMLLDITAEQAKWYLKQYELLGREVFQEYPSSPEEAFLTTGDTVRDLTLIKSLEVPEYIQDSKYRALRIYWKPQNCIMGIDLAEGWANGDFSSISVRDYSGNLLAFYYDHAPHDYLAEVTDYLVEMWFTGIIWPEANAWGIAYINKAKEYWRANSIYTRKQLDTKTNKITKKFWWYTSTQSRELMTREYEEAIRTGQISQVDERLKWEMFGFVYSERKKMEAIEGMHDDAIMSDCICWQMRKEMKIIFQ